MTEPFVNSLIEPYGGKLIDLYAPQSQKQVLTTLSHSLPSWSLTERQLCDIELILNGGFSPLCGFLSEADYHSVIQNLCLCDHTLWPIPITLDVDKDFANSVNVNEKIALRDAEGVLIAIMHISDKWQPDKSREAQNIFGSNDKNHPAVNFLFHKTGDIYLGGNLTGITPPTHYDYTKLRYSPAQLRKKFVSAGWHKIIAFQTQNTMHRFEQAVTLRSAQHHGAHLLIHPVTGMTKPEDADYYSRIRCYQHILKHYPQNTVALNLLPLAMRTAGLRELLWHAIIQQNFGCTHFLIDEKHIFSKEKANTKLELKKYQNKLNIRIIPFNKSADEANPIDKISSNEKKLGNSPVEFYQRLKRGLEIPPGFSYPEIVAELRKTHPLTQQRGFTVFFTGLSGAGKSTLANALLMKFYELGRMRVTLLDGDIVRKKLSSELGFSKQHRNLHVERIGYVASEITKIGGIAICAPIAPYAKTRYAVREMISPYGGFIEVHLSTSLSVCEKRDRKGLYAKARQGKIAEFTGISAPYEIPENPDLIIDTSTVSVKKAIHEILLKLESLGYITN